MNTKNLHVNKSSKICKTTENFETFYFKLPVIFDKYLTRTLFPLPTGPTKQTRFLAQTPIAKFFKFCFVDLTSMK